MAELLREARSIEPVESIDALSEVRTVEPAELDEKPDERRFASEARCEKISGGIHVELESSSGSSSKGEAGGEGALEGRGRVGVNRLRVMGVKTPAPLSCAVDDTGEATSRLCLRGSSGSG